MKKVIFLALAVFEMTVLAAQNKITPQNPKVAADTVVNPPIVVEDPSNAAAWKRTPKNGKAEFSDTTLKKERTVTYDATGNMVISDNSDDPTNNPAYPPLVAEYYTQKYPGEKYRVMWTKDKIGNKVYYITRKTEVFWFNQEGNYTHKSKAVLKK